MPLRRVCIDCQKPCFPKHKTTEPRCRNCSVINRRKNSQFQTRSEYARNWSLKKKYNIDLEEFNLLWIVYKGRCGICSVELKLPEKQRGQALDVVAVDHDHITGKVRGLLCNACNKGLGLFKDSIENLEKAKEYLNVRS